MSETQIEFTDRYGGRPPSWLRGCFGPCEAMGCYPVRAHEANDDVFYHALSIGRDLTPDERGEVRRIMARDGRNEDGWYFIRCPDCNGTGRVSWRTTVARIPRWLWRGVLTLWHTRPGNDVWLGHPAPWHRRAWLAFKVAFLCDLGWRP